MAVDSFRSQIWPTPTNLWGPKPNLLSFNCTVTLVTKVFPHLWQNVYNIVYSQAVTHPSTNTTQCCLTSVIGRELVLSTWYGRRQGTVWKIDHVLNNVQVGLSPTGWLLSAHYTRAILWQNCSLIVSDHYQMLGVRVLIPTTAQKIKLARIEYFWPKFVRFSQTL